MPFLLRTLGTFDLLDAPDGATVLPPGKPLALLTLLSVLGREGIDRDRGLDLLWGNLPAERGRHALRQALHTLRRTIGTDRIETQGDTIRLVDPIASDRHAFLDAANRGDLDQALQLYVGPFLGDVAFPGGAGFEAWRDEERVRLHDRWREVAHATVTNALQAGDGSGALQAALALRSRDPDHEPFWVQVITAHLQAGNTRAAHLEAAALQRHLQAVNRRPRTATRELLERIAPTASPEAPTRPRDPLDAPDLVGRESEFARLLAAWNRAAAGRTQLVHVEGEAGIGKSRLLAALAERLVSVGGRALVCRALPGERRLPYSHLASCLERLTTLPGAAAVDPGTAQVLVRLQPSLGQRFPGAPAAAPGLPESAQLVAACVDLLRTVAFEHPLALLLDDLHWADSASRDVLAVVVGRLERAPLLIVTSARQGGGVAGIPAEQVHLAPLTPDAVAELLTQIGDPPSAEATAWLASQIHDTTHGSPLLIVETLRTLVRHEAIQLRNGQWSAPDQERITALLAHEAPVRQRLALLTPAAAAALEVLAVAGHPVGGGTMSATVERSVDSAAALTALEVAGIARETPEGWEPSHDRYAETALAGITDDTRTARLRALARALLLGGGPTPATDLRHALRHAIDGGATELIPTIGRHWLGLHRQRGVRGGTRRLLRELAESAGASAQMPVLNKALPWTERPGVRGLLAACLVLVVAAGVARWLWWQRQPAVLRLENTPAVFPSEVNPRHPSSEQPPVFTVRDHRGRITTALDGVTLELGERVGVDSASFRVPVVVAGSSVRADGLQLWATDPWDSLAVGFRLSGLRIEPIVMARGYSHQSLQVSGGTLNGQYLDPSAPSVRVQPGDSVRGSVVLRFTTPSVPVIWLVAMGTTFPNRLADTATVASVLVGATDATLAPTLRLRAPDAPGNYWIAWAMSAEPSSEWILSLTNWACKTPSWDDGNDLLAIPDSAMETVWGGGTMIRQRQFCWSGAPSWEEPVLMPIAAIRLIVE
ncbi:MAG: AAA family ATPase [Gemmatimonadetes bacterium]|nr:AAA family ATPase [Gemmatimonadota bacterium]